MRFRSNLPIIAILLAIMVSLVYSRNGEFWAGLVHARYQLFFLIGISGALLFSNRKTIIFTMPDVIVGLLLLYALVGRVARVGSIWELESLQVLLLLSYYIGLRGIEFTEKQVKYYYNGLALLGLGLCCYAVCEWIGVVDSENLYWRVTGGFSNPGPFGGFIALLFSLMLALCINYRRERPFSKLPFLLLASLVVLFAGVILLSGSRAALMASLLAAIVYALVYVRRSFRLRMLVLLLCLPTAGLIICSKSAASISGRLFIWKVALVMASRQPLFGYGYHSFAVAYPRSLITFFADGAASATDMQRASLVQYAFNEVVQLWVEHGVIGVLLVIGLVVLLARRIADGDQAKLIRASSIGFLTAFITFSQFSYPLSFLCFQLLVLHQLAILSSQSTPSGFHVPAIGLILIRLVILGIGAIGSERFHQGLSYWQAAHLMEFQQPARAQVLYKKAEPYLENQAEFLYAYGSFLQRLDIRQSTYQLERCAQLLSSPTLDQKLAYNYEQLGQLTKAEQAYLRAHFVLPMLLEPQCNLMWFYAKQAHCKQARHWARQLLATPVKQQTGRARWLRTQAQYVLDKPAECPTSFSNFMRGTQDKAL